MEKVVIADVKGSSIEEGLDEIFGEFGGVGSVIPQGHRVAIKPNAVHYSPFSHTDPAVVGSLLAYLRDHGYRKLEVMENATAGNFTRLVFSAAGYARLCKRHGARAVYLDEGPTSEIILPGEEEPTRLPKRLYEDFIVRREGRFYLNLPKLKTHSMTTVTLGVKNQQAFPVHADRMARHNKDTLHRRLASIYEIIRPDFCIIEGLNVVFHGHVPPAKLAGECVAPLGVLIGGKDTLAADAVGARALGYEVDEVEHLRLCRERGLGVGKLSEIEVSGAPLSRFGERYPHTLLGRFHPDVRVVEGKEKACTEGCKGNSLCLQEMLTNDYRGKGGWTLVFGKGLDEARLSEATGDILVAGPCAVKERGAWLKERYPGRKIYFVNACNDLMTNATYQARLMGVHPIKMSPINPVKSAWLLLMAKLHGSTARIPPLLG